jgi:cytochrome b561
VKDQSNTAKLSGMTIGLHWLLAIAMIGMLAFGCLEDMPKGEAKSALIWWHKGLGVCALAPGLAVDRGVSGRALARACLARTHCGIYPLVLALGHAVYAGLGRDDVAGIEPQY